MRVWCGVRAAAGRRRCPAVRGSSRSFSGVAPRLPLPPTCPPSCPLPPAPALPCPAPAQLLPAARVGAGAPPGGALHPGRLRDDVAAGRRGGRRSVGGAGHGDEAVGRAVCICACLGEGSNGVGRLGGGWKSMQSQRPLPLPSPLPHVDCGRALLRLLARLTRAVERRGRGSGGQPQPPPLLPAGGQGSLCARLLAAARRLRPRSPPRGDRGQGAVQSARRGGGAGCTRS